MGWTSGFGLKSIGSALNAITGVSSAASQSQRYALQSAQVNNQYQKEFAQNAHQWEMQDLEKSGLNPVLSAGGSGTGASGGGVANGTASPSGINPIESAIGAWNGVEQAQNTGADTERKNAEINNINQDTILKRWQSLTEMEKGNLTKEEREKVQAEKEQIIAMTPKIVKKAQAETKNTEMDTKLKDTQRKTQKVDLGEEEELSILGIPVYRHKKGKDFRGENIH